MRIKIALITTNVVKMMMEMDIGIVLVKINTAFKMTMDFVN